MTEHFPTAAKASWDFQGIYTASRHIPKVRFAGITHPGLIGCAPSVDLLNKWKKREAELVATNPARVPALAQLPNPKNAILVSLKGADFDRVAEAARTVPPREYGGNCDIKNLSRGSIIYFPVYVEGAKLSMGDIHFSPGLFHSPKNRDFLGVVPFFAYPPHRRFNAGLGHRRAGTLGAAPTKNETALYLNGLFSYLAIVNGCPEIKLKSLSQKISIFLAS